MHSMLLILIESCNSLERHNYRLTQIQLNFLSIANFTSVCPAEIRARVRKTMIKKVKKKRKFIN